MAEDEDQAEHLRELHAVCCGRILAAGGKPSPLIDALEEVKASIADELAALGSGAAR